MELVDVDCLDAETVAAREHLIPEVVGVTVREPVAVGVAQQAAFRRHHRLRGVECLADEAFADTRSVGVRRVDEVDTELGCVSEHRACLLLVGRRADYIRAGQSHRTEPETMDSPVTQFERGAVVHTTTGGPER